jgi:hypothetical protein
MVRSCLSAIVSLALLASSSSVHAGDSKLVPNVATQTTSLPEEKSPMIARLYSWVPTLTLSLAGLAVIDEGGGLGSGTWATRAGYGLVLLGMGVGPSGGQIYAGESNYLRSRTALCALSLLLLVAADQSNSQDSRAGGDSGGSGSDHDSGDGFADVILVGGLALASTAMTVTLAMIDLWDAPDAARRANQKSTNLSMMPVLLRSDGSAHWGLGLAGRF